jgi:hypothetical protein
MVSTVPPPAPASSNRTKEKNANSIPPATNHAAPVSGGVMNGRAVSLPQRFQGLELANTSIGGSGLTAF